MQAKERAVNNGLYAQLAQKETASTREFYLAYEDLILRKVQRWRGKIYENGAWVEPEPDSPGKHRMMSEEAISVLIDIIEDFLSVAERLANQDEEYIKTYAYQGRQHASRFLHTKAWLYCNVPKEHLRRISFQVGQIIHTALTWSKNAGGQRFMTRSIISHENVSQLITKMDRDKTDKSVEHKKPW